MNEAKSSDPKYSRATEDSRVRALETVKVKLDAGFMLVNREEFELDQKLPKADRKYERYVEPAA